MLYLCSDCTLSVRCSWVGFLNRVNCTRSERLWWPVLLVEVERPGEGERLALRVPWLSALRIGPYLGAVQDCCGPHGLLCWGAASRWARRSEAHTCEWAFPPHCSLRRLLSVCQFSSAQSLRRVRLCDPMDCRTPGCFPLYEEPYFSVSCIFFLKYFISFFFNLFTSGFNIDM